jgi:hypothetical protein
MEAKRPDFEFIVINIQSAALKIIDWCFPVATLLHNMCGVTGVVLKLADILHTKANDVSARRPTIAVAFHQLLLRNSMNCAC